MANLKFSQFVDGGDLNGTDEIVGLRAGINTKFNSPADPSGPFLLKSANFDDVPNVVLAIQNLGVSGADDALILNDADFAAGGGTYVLTNPPSTTISMNATTPGRILQLPPQNEDKSLQSTQQIEILTAEGSEDIEINTAAGNQIFLVQSGSAWRFLPNDRTTLAGAWVILGEVQGIDLNDGQGDRTGIVSLPVGPINSPEQVLYVSPDGDDTIGDGTIGNPFATYNVARLAAIDAGASATFPFAIQIIGEFTIIGSMLISPFISVVGINRDTSTIRITNAMELDSSWSTAINPIVVIQNITIIAAGGINLIFTGGQANVRILFQGVNPSSSSEINIVGSGAVNTELVTFVDCISFGGGSPFNFFNVVGAVVASSIAGGVTMVGDSINPGALLILQNCAGPAGNIGLQTTGSGTLTAAISNNINISSTFILDGVGITALIDAAGYNVLPTFLNGASFSNINLISLADGVNANQNFTPVNYTPVSDPSFKDNSVTANLAGIDVALGNFVPLTCSFSAFKSSNSADVTGDGTVYHYICDTEIFDTDANYNSTTGVFTAPNTGTYWFKSSVQTRDNGAFNTIGFVEIATTARTYRDNQCSPVAIMDVNTNAQLQVSCYADMTAGDTAFPQVTITGGAALVDVIGGAGTLVLTSFQGFQVR